MSVYPDNVTIEMQLAGTAGAWTDVTEDVLRSYGIRGSYGINDDSPTSRVASTGVLTFALDNSENNSAGLVGYYSPGHTNCRSGFESGIPVRFSVTSANDTFPKFYGRIPVGGIKLSTGIYGDRRCEVEVRDYMEQLATYEITLPTLQEDKRIEEVVAAIVSELPIAPLSTDYATGIETFPLVFDMTQSKTKAISECNKVAMSELGYIFIKHDQDNYEILTVQSRDSRTLSPAVAVIPVSDSESGYLLMENGTDKFLLEDSSGYILLNEGVAISFADDQIDMQVENGGNLYNYINGISYPRAIGTATEVLYKLNSTPSITASGSITIRGSYSDPSGGAKVSAYSMLNPEGTTDYLFNSSAAGTGTNYTANLTVTPTYGVSGVEYVLSNSGTATGYITKLQARGTAIRTYDVTTGFVSDTTSINTNGKQVLNLDMKYQDDPTAAQAIILIMLYLLKDPRTRVNAIKFCANSSAERMSAFLYLDIGHKITIQETVSGINGEYFINGVEFEVMPNDVIFYTWRLKDAAYETTAFWELETVGKSELGETTFVSY